MARRQQASKKRRPKAKRPAKNTYIKQLGLEPVAERTPQVLRDRIRKLASGLKQGRYRGQLAERAEVYLREHRKALKQSA